MSIDAKAVLERCRAELARLVRARGKTDVRGLIAKLAEWLEPSKQLREVSIDVKITVLRLLKVLKCEQLATPEGLEYIRALALDDLDRMP